MKQYIRWDARLVGLVLQLRSEGKTHKQIAEVIGCTWDSARKVYSMHKPKPVRSESAMPAATVIRRPHPRKTHCPAEYLERKQVNRMMELSAVLNRRSA